MSRPAPRPGWVRHLPALLEQGFFACAGLAIQVGVARSVSPEAYGAFAVASAVLLAIAGVHQAFVAEPMVVFAARQGPDEFRGYLARLSSATMAIGLALGAVLACFAGVWLGIDRHLAWTVGGLALALPGSLLFGLLRRGAYAKGKTASALLATIAQGTAAIPVLLGVGGDLAGPAALACMGAGTLVASTFLAASLGVRPRGSGGFRALSWVAREHAEFGGWMAAAGLAHGLAGLVLLPLVAAVAGLDDAGVLRANQLLLAPAQQGLAVFGLVVGPWSARLRRAQGDEALVEAARTLSRRNAACALGYAGLAILLGPPLLVRLTRHPEYAAAGLWLLVPLTLGVVVQASTQVHSLALRAREDARRVFWSKLSSLLALALCTPVVWRFGATGGAFGILVAMCAEWWIVARGPANARSFARESR